ncbi:hypothetical protein AJ85_05775 [Alkalihalobacillus alcalophilus ATCC 27647 = CGMCC 1.3604]|uniref:DnaB/C C-terminal domain-containing protein n=1 Tax=Alkalihalobacillus alcalophilus ATCC 27647 = CGMCC 1.3604 TaxID=1218173 RepID=A0A4V3X8S0_ALKAL|nr:DnaD domain protein [Alkalihalobacillus alcalophilus]YP_009276817.1 replication initiation protein [Bacillus phage BalMu-1]AJA42389.1 chromosome replication initiation protein DnaD [Bacillus phage BalMu-1]AJA42445.1 chromosome replication initiation protein DnaD [Bacillus phage BalMu-1]MED1561134.1 DnaD domain protein [Alkalihalobacillus alcalophilus]THG91332.1 hypothetical protein AJ85_05775 [Alkalihalobacillus alcalophilus ATCC 27647 = CGMCC 1.3604]
MRKLELFYCPDCELDFGVAKSKELYSVQCPICVGHEEVINTERTVNFRPYKEESNSPTALYTMIEREFARPLSPMELQTIGMWLDEDQHSDELIVAALREAVVSNVRTIRYIDRILTNWKQNGITTIQQVREHTSKFRENQPNRFQKKTARPERQESESKRTVPWYNWLEQ